MGESLQFTIEVLGMSEDLRELGRLREELSRNTTELKNLKKSFDDGKISADKYLQGIGLLKVQKDALTNAAKTLNTQINAEATAFKGAEGSMTRMGQELGFMKQQYRDLSAVERDNMQVGGKLLENIQKQDQLLKTLDASIGNHFRKVGEYENATKGLNKTLSEASPVYGKFSGVMSSINQTWTENVTQASGFGKVLGAVSVGIVAATGVAAAMFGAFKAGEAIINSSHNVAEKWEQRVGSMKMGYEAFLRTIATGDWSNLFRNIDTAISKGEKYIAMEQELAKQRGFQEVLSAKAKLQFDELWDKFNDKTLYTTDERIQAGKDAIEISKKDMLQRLELDKAALVNKASNLAMETKLGEATIKKFSDEYRFNEKLIDQADEYNKKQEKLLSLQAANSGNNTIGTLGGTGVVNNTEDIVKLRKELDGTANSIKLFAGVMNQYFSTDDKSIKEYLQRYKQVYDTQDQFYVGIRRLNKQVEGEEFSHNEKLVKDAEEAQKKREQLTQKELELKIKAQQLLEKYDLGGAANDYEREVAEIKRKEEFQSLSEEKQQAILFEIKKKWSAKWLAEAEKKGLDGIKLEKQLIADRQALEKGMYDLLRQYKSQSLQDQYLQELEYIRSLDAYRAMNLEKQDEIELAIDAKYQQKRMDQQVEQAKLQLVTGEQKSTKQQVAGFIKDSFGVTDQQANQAINEAQQLSNKLLSLWQQAQQQRIDNELAMTTNRLEREEKKEMDSLDRQHSQGLISDQIYNKKKQEIQDRYDAEKKAAEREAFEKKKQQSIIDTIINAAVAVIAAYEMGPILGSIFAVIIAALAAYEISTISSQQFVGAKGGMVEGPDHAHGGKKFAVGGSVVELEGGEGVLSRRTMKDKRVYSLQGTPAEIGSFTNIQNGGNSLGDTSRFTPVDISPGDRSRITDSSIGTINDLIDRKIMRLKVQVVESEMTQKQKDVLKVETLSKW